MRCQKVIDFLITMNFRRELRFKALILNLTMLLALLPEHQKFIFLILLCSYLNIHIVTLSILGKIKKIWKNKLRGSTKFHSSYENRNLCVCWYIDFCIEKTKEIRGESTHLFLILVAIWTCFNLNNIKIDHESA